MSTNSPDSTPAQPTAQSDRPHWLLRRSTIRWLWIGSIALLGALVAADVLLHGKGHGSDHGATHGAKAFAYSFGFYAWYGFATCAAMVVFAKLLGFAIKRPDTYYGQPVGRPRIWRARQDGRLDPAPAGLREAGET